MKARFPHFFTVKAEAVRQAKAINTQLNHPSNYATERRFGVIRKPDGRFRVRVLTTKTPRRRIVWSPWAA